MHAALVTDFSQPPRYAEVTDPAGQVVEVLASGLHPRVRSQAAGRHYTSDGALPLVPGVDGVGRRADGTPVWFVVDDGAMADRCAVDPRLTVPLPVGADPVVVAATMNPAMPSWVALRRRVPFEPGQSVLVLGATGGAGGAAVQVARELGAGRVLAAGRNPERLAALDAETVPLGDPRAAADVDVVLDLLWGEPALTAMTALATARADRSRLLSWVQIGAVAGPDLALPSALLRQCDLHVLGQGQGSVGAAAILAEMPSLVEAVVRGAVTVPSRAVPLADVETAWGSGSGQRTVLVP